MRLHGRNAAHWWRHGKTEDRYDYLYSADELKEFTETADAARHIVKKLYLYTNNHFSAKSVANAAMIKQQLGEPLEGDIRRNSCSVSRSLLTSWPSVVSITDRPNPGSAKPSYVRD